MGKETSAVLQRQFCKLSGCGISGMFAQEETADVNFALFVSQGQSYPRLWPARHPQREAWLPEGKVKEQVGWASTRPPVCHLSGKVNSMFSNSS